VADVRFGDVNWGREKPWCPKREGALCTERSQGEREHAQGSNKMPCSGDTLVHTEREHSPSWSTLGRRYFASPRMKGPLGTMERPFNSREQRHV